MKPITITIDAPTERKLNYLMGHWKTNKSETIRYCVDTIFTDKCYNKFGIVAVQHKKGGKRNAMSNTKN